MPINIASNYNSIPSQFTYERISRGIDFPIRTEMEEKAGEGKLKGIFIVLDGREIRK